MLSFLYRKIDAQGLIIPLSISDDLPCFLIPFFVGLAVIDSDR